MGEKWSIGRGGALGDKQSTGRGGALGEKWSTGRGGALGEGALGGGECWDLGSINFQTKKPPSQH